MSQVPLFNKQKRKREGSGSFGSLENGVKSPKKRNERTFQSLVAPSNSAHLVMPNEGDYSSSPATAISQPTPGEIVEKSELVTKQILPPRNGKSSSSYDIMDLTTLQQTIESQFSLEILLKHRELRLIDQELGKCQVALEQLRRCQIMPYPASSSDPNVMQTVSSGVGSAHDTQALSPAPWGVTDGPYSRHYTKWLIPDAVFGDNVSNDQSSRAGGNGLSDRATRGSKSSKAQPGSTRAQRGSARDRLQSLPHGYPEPKEDKGPMIVKRSTDGQMVKLVCLDCRRSDFNSAQGFINHCRIAHSRGFASHDAAAIACGEEVDSDSPSGVQGVTSGSSNPTAALVHPLIRCAHPARSPPQTSSAIQQSRKKQHSKATVSSGLFGNLDGSSDVPSTPQAGPSTQLNVPSPFPFNPSPQTPHLSALFARCRRGGDLNEMVTEATLKPEPDTSMSDDENDNENIEESVEPPVPPGSQGTLGIHGVGRLPARSGMSPAPLERTPSSKRAAKPNQRRPEYLNPFLPGDAPPYSQTLLSESDYITHHNNQESQTLTSPPITSPTLNLSPNTSESHPAPSLVSDDGDFDNQHSESETPSSAIESDDEDSFEVEVKDHEHHPMDIDHHGGSEYGLGKQHDDHHHHHHHAPQPPRRRRPSAIRDPELADRGRGLGQRRVSFQSPVPMPVGVARGKGGERKKGRK